MPAMIAAAHDLDAARVRPRDADARRRRVGAGLKKDAHFRRGHELAQFFRELILIGLGQGETEALVPYLPDHGLIDFFFPVAQDDRPITAEEVDIFIAVDVDQSAPFAGFEKDRVFPLDEVARFSRAQDPAGNEFLCLLKKLQTFRYVQFFDVFTTASSLTASGPLRSPRGA